MQIIALCALAALALITFIIGFPAALWYGEKCTRAGMYATRLQRFCAGLFQLYEEAERLKRSSGVRPIDPPDVFP